MSLVAYDSSDEDSGTEQENYSVSATKQRSQRSLISILPHPSNSGSNSSSNKKKTVRIGLPTFTNQDDSDVEEGGPPASKKTKGAGPGTSGLMSLLPKPRATHGQVQLDVPSFPKRNVDKKTTSTLVPHSVSKNRKQKLDEKPTLQNDTSDDDEEEGGPISFFSCLSQTKSEETVEVMPQAGSINPSPSLQSLPTLQSPFSIPTSSSHSSPSAGSHPDYDGYQHMYATSVQPSEYNPVDYAVGGSTSNIPQEVRENGNMQLNDEAMKRLMGHKNWKRKNEAVNLTNISENEIVQSGQHMRLLHSTEEQQILSSQAKKNVSSTAKRKHQITFLVAEAQARELELKNQWAQNRLTRKQTQMKYGF